MSNKTICVAGATGRNSTAVVARFLEDSHQVVAAENADIAQPVRVRQESLHPISFDIRDALACEAAIAETAVVFGELDALMNVAGNCHGGGPDVAGVEEWQNTFDVDVKGMFQLTKFALPHLQKKPRADIVNIASIWGTDHTHALLSYSAAKLAVEGDASGFRLWGMPRNIRVCAIQVDKVDTGFRQNLGAAGEFPPEKLAKMLRPTDVAQAVAFALTTPDTAQVSSMRLDAPLWYQE